MKNTLISPLLSLLLLAGSASCALAQDIPTVKGHLRYIFAPVCKQASFICDGQLVCLSNDGHAKSYPLYSTADSIEFDLASVTMKPHCNVANLVRKGGRNYLYVTEWNQQRRLFVEQIAFSPQARQWSTRLVQTFTLQIPDSIMGAGFCDWVVDARKQRLYLFTYCDPTPDNDRKGTGVILMEMKLPRPTDGDRTFTQQDILRRVKLPYMAVTQDKEVHRGKLYITAGLRTSAKRNWDKSRQIMVFDLKTFQPEKFINLSHHNDEPEGIDFVRGPIPGNRHKGWHMLLTYRNNMYELTTP